MARVFFDDVGWPWPKHGCTDKYKGSDDKIMRATNSILKFHFKGRDGKLRDVYLFDQFIPGAEDLVIRLKSIDRRERVQIAISLLEMSKNGIAKSDIEGAPSLVMTRREGTVNKRELSFLSARLQSVVVLAVSER